MKLILHAEKYGFALSSGFLIKENMQTKEIDQRNTNVCVVSGSLMLLTAAGYYLVLVCKCRSSMIFSGDSFVYKM